MHGHFRRPIRRLTGAPGRKRFPFVVCFRTRIHGIREYIVMNDIERASSGSDPSFIELGELRKSAPYTPLSEDRVRTLGDRFALPDGGESVRRIADKAPGGAFDPRDLERIAPEKLGYAARWVVLRYRCYGLDWDITGLRLESRNPRAKELPWLIVINGGSANVYEFFVDPFNRAGLGQYLAQAVNVLLVTIPGNFKYGGWTLPPSRRVPQYLLDRELPPEEVTARNAIYTNSMIMEGLKRLLAQETTGDILIVGHSTSGELAFLAMDEPALADRLKGRFLGWGSGGAANFRTVWEREVRGSGNAARTSTCPVIGDLRIRDATEYVNDGYLGPLNPCAGPNVTDAEAAAKWLSLVERGRPNIKQALQDLEHQGAIDLQVRIEGQIEELLARGKLRLDIDEIRRDLFAANRATATGYKKMVWLVAKWDKRHWHRTAPEQAFEHFMADQYRAQNPAAAIRVLVFDMPMTHYGHVEKPREVAAALLGATRWLVRS